MEDPEYHAKTSAFLAWLSQAGVQMNPKIQVADFRQDGRGRGVGNVTQLLPTPSVTILFLWSSLIELGRPQVCGSQYAAVLTILLVVAVADLQEDEVVFSIPRSAVLNLNTALPSIPDKSTREAIQAMPSWLVDFLGQKVKTLRPVTDKFLGTHYSDPFRIATCRLKMDSISRYTSP